MSRKKCSFLSFEAGVTVRCAEFSMYFLLFQVLRRVGAGGQFRLEPRLDSQVMFRFGWSAATDWLLAPPGSLDRKGWGEISHKILRKETVRLTSLVLNNASVLEGLGRCGLEYSILSITQIAPRKTFSPLEAMELWMKPDEINRPVFPPLLSYW